MKRENAILTIALGLCTLSALGILAIMTWRLNT